MQASEIVDNRFGLGARGSVREYSDPKRALLQQIERFDSRPVALQDMPTAQSVGETTGNYLESLREGGIIGEQDMDAGTAPEQAKRAVKLQQAVRKFVVQSGRDYYFASITGRFAAAVESETPFMERLVHFWSNHFAISVDKTIALGFAGLMEFEAIRPNMTGKFADLLKAVEQHPGMLLYLDQAQSIGPNSLVARRINNPRRKRQLGLNENLAREIMELHTLGVNGGYSQADVTEFARALTGWTVSGLSRGPIARRLGLDGTPGKPVFAEAIHEPGARTILGKNYVATGGKQAARILDDFAVHPSTARFLSQKLATYFLSDDPPEAMVTRMEKAYLKSDGDLPALYRALIESPEMWAAGVQKFKQPWEWLVSSYRATQMPMQTQPRQIANILKKLGQPVWRPGSPAGWGDRNSDWIGPDSIYRRVETANVLTARVPADVDARQIAPALFPVGLSEKTKVSLARAESPKQALAMLLVSPEFLMR